MNKNILRFLLFLIVATGIAVVIINRDQLDQATLQQWLNDAGSAAPLLFMLVYIVGTVFFLPGSLLTLLGGVLFGPVMGTFYNLTAATIGAMLSFIVARYLASDWVANKTGGRMKQLINGVESEGWRFVAFVRLVPLFPFNLLNYALGLTRISLTQYSIATYICMLPGAIAYTYLGYAGREAIAGDASIMETIQIGSIALALLAIVMFLPRLIARLRQKPMMEIPGLKEKLDAGEELLVLDVRTTEDFVGEQGHIAGATNIPLEELESRLEEVMDYEERAVAIVCRTDRKSEKAARILAQNGFSDVHVAKGGMTEWIANGYPIE